MSQINLIFSDVFSKVLPEFPDYVIYEDGKIYSMLTKKYISFHERGEMMYIRLIKIVDGERKRISIAQHQILALAFIPNPEILPVIRHKDGNGLNNDLDNLEWSTRKEIIQKKYDEGLANKGTRPVVQYSLDKKIIKRFESIKEAAEEMNCSPGFIGNVCSGRKKSANGFVWRYETEKDPFEVEEGEEWKNIPNHKGYKVSSKGRVYSIKTARYLNQIIRKDNYVQITLDDSKYFLHRLVAKTFYGPPPENLLVPVVDHKDGDTRNNTLENLEWVEFDENISRAHKTGLNSTSRPVLKYSLGGVQLKRYKSAAEASRDVKVTHASVMGACRKKEHVNTIAGFIWRFESEPLSLNELQNVKQAKTEVVQYTLEGKKIKDFLSIKEASEETKTERTSISHACRGKIKAAGGFVWRYKRDPPPTEKVRSGGKRGVDQLTLQCEHIKTWNSIMEASKELKISDSHISSVCRGKRNTTGGFKWKYID